MCARAGKRQSPLGVQGALEAKSPDPLHERGFHPSLGMNQMSRHEGAAQLKPTQVTQVTEGVPAASAFVRGVALQSPEGIPLIDCRASKAPPVRLYHGVPQATLRGTQPRCRSHAGGVAAGAS
eukprot:scaffold21795_cov43-Phaeocystis_antarctica.AAC.2